MKEEISLRDSGLLSYWVVHISEKKNLQHEHQPKSRQTDRQMDITDTLAKTLFAPKFIGGSLYTCISYIIVTLNEISKFSPPHTSIPGSYAPISKKYFLSAANNPPAMVGDLDKFTLKIYIMIYLKFQYLYQQKAQFKNDKQITIITALFL